MNAVELITLADAIEAESNSLVEGASIRRNRDERLHVETAALILNRLAYAIRAAVKKSATSSN